MIAGDQRAKAPELRAAMSLGRLWQRRGKSAEARELLTPILRWLPRNRLPLPLRPRRHWPRLSRSRGGGPPTPPQYPRNRRGQTERQPTPAQPARASASCPFGGLPQRPLTVRHEVVEERVEQHPRDSSRLRRCLNVPRSHLAALDEDPGERSGLLVAGVDALVPEHQVGDLGQQFALGAGRRGTLRNG